MWLLLAPLCSLLNRALSKMGCRPFQFTLHLFSRQSWSNDMRLDKSYEWFYNESAKIRAFLKDNVIFAGFLKL